MECSGWYFTIGLSKHTSQVHALMWGRDNLPWNNLLIVTSPTSQPCGICTGLLSSVGPVWMPPDHLSYQFLASKSFTATHITITKVQCIYASTTLVTGQVMTDCQNETAATRLGERVPQCCSFTAFSFTYWEACLHQGVIGLLLLVFTINLQFFYHYFHIFTPVISPHFLFFQSHFFRTQIIYLNVNLSPWPILAYISFTNFLPSHSQSQSLTQSQSVSYNKP